MSSVAAAIALWTVYFVVGFVLQVFTQIASNRAVWLFRILNLLYLSVFIAGVIMTIRAENERHDQGGQGLGPAGIFAIVATVVPSTVIGLYTALQNVHSNI